MSYRTYLNDFQILGNNEYSKDLIEELQRQGCEVDEDGCFDGFEIKELQPIIEALEKYILKKKELIEKLHKNEETMWSICDFTDSFNTAILQNDLTSKMIGINEGAYIFVTANFLREIKNDYDIRYDTEKDRIVYNIKEGHHIYMSAY